MYHDYNELYHYGVKGMRWGVRRTPEQLGHKPNKKVAKYLGNSKIKDTTVEDAIRSGEVSKTINKQKQSRHTKSGHMKGRSYLDGDLDYAQELIDKLSGTGEALVSANGAWNNRERVVSPHITGTHVDATGKETKSNISIIVYSRTGSHIYPAKREENDNGT